MTEVQVVDGDDVALTIGRPSPDFAAEFAVLFAELRHPTDAELVAAGLDFGPSPLQ